jgi:hypothetical protein
LFKLMWYMRGSMTMNEAFALSLEDRKIINDIIKENLETTKKTQMPFF